MKILERMKTLLEEKNVIVDRIYESSDGMTRVELRGAGWVTQNPAGEKWELQYRAIIEFAYPRSLKEWDFFTTRDRQVELLKVSPLNEEAETYTLGQKDREAFCRIIGEDLSRLVEEQFLRAARKP